MGESKRSGKVSIWFRL